MRPIDVFRARGAAGSNSVSFVAASGATYATATSINTPSSPAGIANGDGLFAIVFARSALTPPAGWTLVGSQANVGATTQTLYIYRKDTVTTGDSSTAFSWGQSVSGRMGLAYVVARSTSGTITEAQVSGAETDYAVATAYPQNVTVPTLTAGVDGELFLIAATCELTSGSWPWTAATGATLRTTTPQTDNRLIAATQSRNTGQSNASPMTTGTGSASVNYHSSLTLRLAP